MTEKDQLRQQVEETWKRFNEEDPCQHCGPGNGCDDCRGCEKRKIHHELYNIANEIRKQFKEKYGHEYDEKISEERRTWHDFPLSVLKDTELLELCNEGYITNSKQMFYIEELKPFYEKVKKELHNRGHIV